MGQEDWGSGAGRNGGPGLRGPGRHLEDFGAQRFLSLGNQLHSLSHTHLVISFETRLQGGHLKSRQFNAMYHNIWITAPAVNTYEGPVIFLQGLPNFLY